MSFYSTWRDVRTLGLDDSVFIESFIKRSDISELVFNDGSNDEIIEFINFLSNLPEKELVTTICKIEQATLCPSDVPCFSTFNNGATRLNELLEFTSEGLNYAEIGYQLVGATGQYAQVKYGENHAKLAAMMSLVTISDYRPANVRSTALGHYMVTLSYEEKMPILKKLLLRSTCIQAIIRGAVNGIADYRKVVEHLSDSTAYRRRTSVKWLVEFALDLPDTKYLLDKIVWDL